VDADKLVSGGKAVGVVEENVRIFLDALRPVRDKVIVFIDEIHTIVGAGRTEENPSSVTDMLKRALSDGDIRMIGATTLEEFTKYTEKEKAFVRRFEIHEIQPTDPITTMLILSKRYKKDEDLVTYELVTKCVELTNRYILNRSQPAKSIKIMDALISNRRMEDVTKNARIKAATDRRNALESFKEKENDPDAKIKYKKEIEKENDEILYLGNQMDTDNNRPIEISDLEKHIEEETGIIIQEDKRDAILQDMQERINRAIKGQKDAVKIVSESIITAPLFNSGTKKPIASFLFVGKTGTGKTELAKRINEVMYSSTSKLVRINAPDIGNISDLIGAPPGYVGYGTPGKLTGPVWRRPGCVVLIDEIEKGDPLLDDTLLSVIDEGELTDSMGQVVSFTNTVIVVTTNVGAELIKPKEKIKDADMRKALQDGGLKPEFLARFSNIIYFEALDDKTMIQLFEKEVNETKAIVGKNLGVTIELDFEPGDLSVANAESARDIKRIVESKFRTFALEYKKQFANKKLSPKTIKMNKYGRIVEDKDEPTNQVSIQPVYSEEE
jgi:ATP-dependent Clp protease ATP-binding subunit ClpC